MEKPVSFRAVYEHHSEIFNCRNQEFLEKAAERYKINMEHIELFANKRGQIRKIRADEINDMMTVQLIPKSALTDGQRSLTSYFANGARNKKSFTDGIITKLTNNTPFTGLERKQLIDWIKEHDVSSSQKRKISDVNSNSKKSFSNKKVQINLSLTNSKDSFAQTNFSQIEDNKDYNEESIVTEIKKLASCKNVNQSEIKKLMQRTYEKRRQYIVLERPIVKLVKEKYPFLFSFEEVKNELDRLFYPGKCAVFLKNMIKYSKFILDMCRSSELEDLYLRTQKSIEYSHTDHQKTYARVVGSIFILTKFLEENDRFIHLIDSPSGSSGSTDVYPHIDAALYSLKEIYTDNSLLRIIVEDQLLCEAPNFQEAILCLMASFFIFDIDYPPSNRRTFTVMEKLFLEANDTKDMDEMTDQVIKMLQVKVRNEEKER